MCMCLYIPFQLDQDCYKYNLIFCIVITFCLLVLLVPERGVLKIFYNCGFVHFSLYFSICCADIVDITFGEHKLRITRCLLCTDPFTAMKEASSSLQFSCNDQELFLFCFLIQPNNLFLLIGAFSALTFNIRNDLFLF